MSSSPLAVGSMECLWRPTFLAQYSFTVGLPALASAGVIAIFLTYTIVRYTPVQAWWRYLRACTRRSTPTLAARRAGVSALTRKPEPLAADTAVAVDVPVPALSSEVAPAAPAAASAVSEYAAASAAAAAANMAAANSIKRDVKAWWSQRRHISALVFVFFLAYMSISSVSLRALDCTSYTIAGTKYLLLDLRVVRSCAAR